MVEQYNVQVIVMLCNLREGTIEKCADYWGKEMEKYKVEVLEENKFNEYLVIRKFKLINVKKENNFKEITQLHFIGWPDAGVPKSELTYDTFLEMFDVVKKNKKDLPMVVHCSAGVGRTGTFIAMYNLYNEILQQIDDLSKKDIEFSIFNLVRKMKEMRMFLVQNISQYLFVHKFIKNLLDSIN